MKIRLPLLLATLMALAISQPTASSGNVIGYDPVYPDGRTNYPDTRTDYNFNGQTDYQNS